MNKTELVAAIAEKAGLTKKDAEQVLTATFEVISDAMAKGEKVQVAGFGAFEVKTREARTCRNPKTGEAVEVGASRVPAFKAGKVLKEKVAK